MTLPREEFLCGNASRTPSGRPPHWLRPALQWFAVGAAHLMLTGAALQIPPPARQEAAEVIIQASLVMPQLPAYSAPPAPPAQPEAPRPEPPPPRPPRPQKKPVRKPPQPTPMLAATPLAENIPSGLSIAESPPSSTPEQSGPESAEPEASGAPGRSAAPLLVPPVFNAAYLENPPPRYPSMSRRLGEQGRVLLRVFVSTAGRAEQVEIESSSGFQRLDNAARDAVAGWRFIPARRGSEPVAAWVGVPVAFVMQDAP